MNAAEPPILPGEEDRPQAPETVTNTPRPVDVLTGLLGGVAALIVFCACLLLGGGLLYQTLQAAPLPLPFGKTNTPSATSTRTPPPLPTPLPTRTPTITPTRTSTPIIPATVDPQLLGTPFEAGPWLIISSSDGLWALSYDAYQLVQLEASPILAPARLESGMSPSGAHLAYILSSGPQKPGGLTLVIQHLPDGQRRAVIQLSADSGSSSSEESSNTDARRAILSMEGLAWSPDGRWLAFTGMQDNLSADLYVYSLDNDQVTRLTESSQHEINPVWSPDSTRIVYQVTGEIPESGAPRVSAVQVVDARNGAISLLYQTSSRGETLAGWLDLNTAFLFSRQLECDGTALQSVRITSGVADSLFEGCFSDALYDARERNLFFSVSASLARDCPCRSAGQEPGLFFLPAGLGLPQKLSSESILELRRAPGLDGFFARTETGWMMAFNSKGEKREIPPAVQGLLPVADAASGRQAWSGPEGSVGLGLWLNEGQGTPRRIFAGSPFQPHWSPGGETLIFFSGSTLYSAFSPAFSPNEMTSFPAGALQSAWLPP